MTQRASENLVFVEGGTFMLGDIGVLEERPYTTHDDKPPVEVSLDSYSIAKYETTWKDFVLYLEDVSRAKDYTVEAGFVMAHVLPMESTKDPLSPNYSRKPALAESSVLAKP